MQTNYQLEPRLDPSNEEDDLRQKPLSTSCITLFKARKPTCT